MILIISAVKFAQNVSIPEQDVVLCAKQRKGRRERDREEREKGQNKNSNTIICKQIITSSSNFSFVPPYSGTNTLSPTATDIGIISPSYGYIQGRERERERKRKRER